jgi:hypothetical protein
MEGEMDDVQVHEESEARRLLGAAAATIPGGGDLLGGVRRRRAARKRRRQIALAAGSGMAALVIAAGTLLSVSAAGAPSAYAAVTAAVSRMSSTSYRVSAVSNDGTGSFAAMAQGNARPVQRLTGQFDPIRRVGWEIVRPVGRDIYSVGRPREYQFRYLGDIAYSLVDRGADSYWLEFKGASPGYVPTMPTSSMPELPSIVAVVQPTIAQGLLSWVRGATDVRDDGPASGPGWTGTNYSFSMTFTKDLGRLAGTIAVDQQGRVRHLGLTLYLAPVDRITQPPLTDDVTFSDFGVPVSVSAPPASLINTHPVFRPAGPPVHRPAGR